MYKRFILLFLILILLLSCAQKQTAQEGSDLTLNYVININDLPYVGPVSVKQTQMISDNIMRSTVSTLITVAGEPQEITSVLLIDLNENLIYMVNDRDSNYVKMTFADFNQLLTFQRAEVDTAAEVLELTRDAVELKDADKKVIGQYGECVPLEIDMALGESSGSGEYQSNMQGKMWLASSIKNSDLFVNFKKKSLDMIKNSNIGGVSFLGITGSMNLNEDWLAKINDAIVGIPVQAEFKISMPVAGDQIVYGISLNLEDYTTVDVNKELLAVPNSYKQVEFSDFNMF